MAKGSRSTSKGSRGIITFGGVQSHPNYGYGNYHVLGIQRYTTLELYHSIKLSGQYYNGDSATLLMLKKIKLLAFWALSYQVGRVLQVLGPVLFTVYTVQWRSLTLWRTDL